MSHCGQISGIQLDLKYLMYNKGYLSDLLEWLPTQGINTILLEYEDKFPYEKYPFLKAEDAFSPSELRAFLKKARLNGLRVIPLVQSLSHLEFALDHPELSHLREKMDIPTQICPSNPDAVKFILDLMTEVLEYHKEDEFFHIGGDETWFLGSCAKCAEWKESSGIINMWAEHQKPILEFIVDQGKRPIVWDDIFWKDFESVNSVDIPKKTVLMCWNYNITSLDVDNSDSEDSEFGGAAQALKQVEIYHNAGFETIGCPCCNYGQLFPRNHTSIANTRTWCAKATNSDMLGIINSSWACFHIPLQTQLPYFTATGALIDDPRQKIDSEWFREWGKCEFGADIPELGSAMADISELWEIPMPEYGRGFSPLVYCYMNMVLHYPGRQEERKKRGAYPNDWSEIDFNAMYLKGVVECSRENTDIVFKRLDTILGKYPVAVATFRNLKEEAKKNQETAGIYALFAALKLLSAKTFSFLLRETPDADVLIREYESIEKPLKDAIGKCYEPKGVERMMRAWWEPGYEALREATKDKK